VSLTIGQTPNQSRRGGMHLLSVLVGVPPSVNLSLSLTSLQRTVRKVAGKKAGRRMRRVYRQHHIKNAKLTMK